MLSTFKFPGLVL